MPYQPLPINQKKWFGSYDLALIPIAVMLGVGASAWHKVDATEELIPEVNETAPPSTAVAATAG